MMYGSSGLRSRVAQLKKDILTRRLVGSPITASPLLQLLFAAGCPRWDERRLTHGSIPFSGGPGLGSTPTCRVAAMA